MLQPIAFIGNLVDGMDGAIKACGGLSLGKLLLLVRNPNPPALVSDVASHLPLPNLNVASRLALNFSVNLFTDRLESQVESPTDTG